MCRIRVYKQHLCNAAYRPKFNTKCAEFVLGGKDSKLEVRGGIVDTGCTAVVAHSSSVDARGVLQSRREAGKRNAGMEV